MGYFAKEKLIFVQSRQNIFDRLQQKGLVVVISTASWSLTEGEKLVAQLFEEVYGHQPDGVWSAPGRVNIIGEHTDYNEGLALPIALPHRAFVAVKKRDDRIFRLVDEDKELIELNLDEVGPVGTSGEVKSWAAYLVGVLWAIEDQGTCEHGSLPGFDVALRSCVPRGGGLSSSAALECSIGTAVDELAGLGLAGSIDQPNDQGRIKLVDACIAAENYIAGAPTGGMDQSASLRCRAGYALELDCLDGSVTQVPFDLDKAGIALLVVDTCAPHALNDGQYAARRKCCEEAAAALGLKSLREITDNIAAKKTTLDAELAKLPSNLHVMRTRHVVTEIERTRDLVELLGKTPIAELDASGLEKVGALLNGSHDSLRDDYEVTCPELDLVVDTARATGAIGARMTGGGFGGSAIALVRCEDRDRISQAIADAFAKAGFNEPHFLAAVPSMPAGR